MEKIARAILGRGKRPEIKESFELRAAVSISDSGEMEALVR